MIYMFKQMLTILMIWLSSISYPTATEPVNPVQPAYTPPAKTPEVTKPLPQVEVEVETYSPPYDHFYVEGKVDVKIVNIDDPYDYQASKNAVDDPNTGASMQYYSALWIGDHNYQGFSMLPSVQIGDLAQWHGNQYICYDADDYAWLDENQQIRCYDGSYLSDKEVIVTCTCKTNTTRYLRYWKLK